MMKSFKITSISFQGTSFLKRYFVQRIEPVTIKPQSEGLHFFFFYQYPFLEILAVLPGYGYSSRKSSATQSYKCIRISVIHRTLAWTTGSFTCVRYHSFACVYRHGGWAHQQRASTTFLTLENSPNFFLCFFRGPSDKN